MSLKWALLQITLIFIGYASTAVASPFDEEEIDAGAKIVSKMCSSCHAMAASTGQGTKSRTIAPSMQQIAEGNKATLESLRVFLLSTHSNAAHPGNMPNLELTEGEIWQIAAYLSSLHGENEQ
jgi:mono/diheme cytochrome c family protein